MLLLRFHPFGHHVDAQLVCHGDDGLAQHQVLRVAAEVGDEAAINFDVVDGKAFEVGQRGVTGAEVVQRQLHARLLQGVQFAVAQGVRLQQHPFGDFNRQRFAGQLQAAQVL